MAPTSPRPSARANEGSRPSLHHGLGLGPTLVTSLGPRAGTGTWSRPSAHAPARAYRLLLPRRDCLPTRLPQRDRPGCNASPQDRESTPSGSLAGPVTVRDHARLRPASVSLSRPGHAPPKASTVYRSRQVGLRALPDPATSRLDARVAQGPVRSTEQYHSSNRPAKDPSRSVHGLDYMTSTSHPRAGAARSSRDAAQGTWCESHTMAPAVCM